MHTGAPGHNIDDDAEEEDDDWETDADFVVRAQYMIAFLTFSFKCCFHAIHCDGTVDVLFC